jgi:hypothetical protein
MPEQELNLVQFSTSKMAEPAQVRRRSCGASFGISARAAAAFTISHSTFGVMPFPIHGPFCQSNERVRRLRYRSPSAISQCQFSPKPVSELFGYALLYQHVRDNPALLARLNRINAQGQQFAASQTAADQHGKYCVVPYTAQ